jgi:hypothetical protein
VEQAPVGATRQDRVAGAVEKVAGALCVPHTPCTGEGAQGAQGEAAHTRPTLPTHNQTITLPCPRITSSPRSPETPPETTRPPALQG